MKKAQTRYGGGKSKVTRPNRGGGDCQVSSGDKDTIHVFCRLRPSKGSTSAEEDCIICMNDKVIRALPPERNSGRETRYTFEKVFDESVTQSSVFEAVGMPLVKKLVDGENGLLFTYGVTGSGKTYTMTGPPGGCGAGGEESVGVMPRCLDLLFNSLQGRMAHPRTFRPDRLNGFELQSEVEALAERQREFIASITASKQNKLTKKDSDPDLTSRPLCSQRLDVPPGYLYSVFVTYVEVYNNAVYDLLEDGTDDTGRPRVVFQTKVVREDCSRNMYVHGAVELEIGSADEAFEVFIKGQRRKRTANTKLNQDSSRSHSVFTIRLVQMSEEDVAYVGSNDGKQTVGISQLSLVDLAGSERTNRTKNTGIRLREAGNINNSLMTLRTCLELLRENQMTGGNKVIPYRESRLTHLFKTFFEGDGTVYMIVCINPHSDDYEETVQALKFAETSQEVQVPCPTPHKMTLYTPSGRRNAGILKRMNADSTDDSENDLFVVPRKLSKRLQENSTVRLLVDFPCLKRPKSNDENFTPNLLAYFETNACKINAFIDATMQKGEKLREMMTSFEREAGSALAENQALKVVLDKERCKVSDLEAELSSKETRISIMKRKMDDCDQHLKKLKNELNSKESLLSRKKADEEKVKQIYSTKIAHEKEKMKSVFEKKLRTQKSALEMEMRSRENKIQEVRRILSSDYIASTPKSGGGGSAADSCSGGSTAAPPPQTPDFLVPTSSVVLQSARKLGLAVSNRRHRRSKSADASCRGEKWLEHRAALAAPLNTVMQPAMRKRRSVTKLTDVKDVTDKEVSKYCLVTQNQDSDGDLETRLYKGDVIPTAGGGAQVTFNDVEILKQESPTVSPPRTRRANRRAGIGLGGGARPWQQVENNCAVALEGHPVKNRP